MNNENVLVTEGEIHLYEWQYDRLGSFFHHIMEAISRADTKNIDKLRKAYPEEVEAYKNYSGKEGYWLELKNRMQTYYRIRSEIPQIPTFTVKS